MAFSIKDNLTFTGTGTGSSVHMNNVANGDNLFVAIAVNQGSTNAISSVTDSSSNTYTRAGSYAGTSIEVEFWYALNATVNTGTTLTITPAVGTYVWSANWIDSTGEGITNSFDQTAGSSGNGTTNITSGATPSTVKPNEIVFGVGGQANNRPWSVGSGFTSINQAANGANASVFAEYKTVTSTGAQTATASIDIASNWVFAAFTFADSNVSGTVIAPSLMLTGAGS